MNKNKKISLIGLAMALMLVCNLLLPPQFSFATDASPTVTLGENSGTTAGDASATQPSVSPTQTTPVQPPATNDTTNTATGGTQANNSQDPPAMAVNLQNTGTNAAGKTWEGTEAWNAISISDVRTQNGDQIYAGEYINLLFDFTIKTAPTNTSPVTKDDTIILELSSDFKAQGARAEKDIEINNKKIGTALFETKNDKLYVTITFEKSANFDGSDLNGTITAYLAYKNDKLDNRIDANFDKHTLTVFPARIPVYTLNKEGTITKNGTILWTITAGATLNGKPYSLQGTKIVDNLKKVGAFVESSFMVDDQKAQNFSRSGNTLTYQFGNVTQQKISFETKFNEYYAPNTSVISKNNSAILQKNVGEEITTAETTVNFNPINWITKLGRKIDNKNEIEWTITINEPKANLTDVIISDILSTGQSVQSAKFKENGQPERDILSLIQSKPSEIKLGNISDVATITIVTSYTTPSNYSNTATLKSKEITDPRIKATAVVPMSGVGISKELIPKYPDRKLKHPKSISPFDADLITSTLEWKISVDNSTDDNHVIYELLVYDEKSWNQLSDTVKNSFNLPEKIKESFGLKYYTESPQNFINKREIIHGGKTIAELLSIRVGDIPLDAENQKIFSYKTKVLDRDAVFSMYGKTMINIAHLYNGNNLLSLAEARGIFQNSQILKTALEPTTSTATNLDLNQNFGNVKNYNFENREIFYRLSINSAKADFTQYENKDGKLPPIVISDEFPKELELVNFEDTNTPYKIFRSTESISGTEYSNLINDYKDKLSELLVTDLTTEKISVNTSEDSKVKFTFEELNKPYVIVIRMRLKESVYLDYVAKAKASDTIIEPQKDKALRNRIANNLRFNYENTIKDNGFSRGLATEFQAPVLTKASDAKNDVVQWVVNYQPYLLAATQENVKLVDTIPEGIDLQMDENGKPIIEIEEQTMGESYAYKNPKKLTLEEANAPIVNYNPDNRQLSIEISDKAKAYRISYFTPYSAKAQELSGNTGVRISNTIQLLHGEEVYRSQSASHEIKAGFSISAWLSKIGGVQITKVDADEPTKKLRGAIFGLYQGNLEIKQGATNEKGELIFAPLAVGEYTLREITSPNGYDKSEVSYTISVTQNGKDKQTVVTKTGESNPVENKPLIQISNKKTTTTPPPTGGGANQGSGNTPKDPPTPPSTPPSTSGSGGGTPNNSSNVRPNPSTPTENKDKNPTNPEQKPAEKPNPTPEPAPIPVNTNPKPGTNLNNNNSNPSSVRPSGTSSGRRRIIGYTPEGEPIYDDATPFDNREKEDQAKKSKQNKNNPGRIGSAPKTGTGQISLSSIGMASGSFAILIVALRERFLSKKRINK
ncbi:MAG: SpaA isopeptide-forming pilin-related protein [Peptostreptococcaceae bacterium]|nr:SpaA isopeptide-forming pilin-related protein [Peptostreptococcaceae bacterium]